MAKYLALVGLAATFAGVALAAPTPAVVTGTMASFDAVVAEPVRARRAATTTGPCKSGQQISYFDCFCHAPFTNFNQVCASKKLKTADDCKAERGNYIRNGDLPGFFRRCAAEPEFLQRCSKECCKEPSAKELSKDKTRQMGMCQVDRNADGGVRFIPGVTTCGSGRRQRSIEFAAGGPDGAGDLADDEVDEEEEDDDEVEEEGQMLAPRARREEECYCPVPVDLILDDDSWKSQKGNKSCKWISNEPKKRCHKTGKKYKSDGGETAAQACRAACDKWAK